MTLDKYLRRKKVEALTSWKKDQSNYIETVQKLVSLGIPWETASEMVQDC